MKTVSLSLLLIITGLISTAQSRLDSLLTEVEHDKRETFNSLKFTLIKNRNEITLPTSKTYESQGMYHSTYLIFNFDSSFIYYSVYEVGFDLSIGHWTKMDKDTFVLNWDRKHTINLIKDKDKKYFDYSYPTPVPITNWKLKIVNDKIKPIK